MIATGFEFFGKGHLVALALTAAVAVVLVAAGRALRGRPALDVVAGALLGAILVGFVVDPIQHWAFGQLDFAEALPLQLCDAAGFATVVALWTRRQKAFELAYFWGLSGTFQALLTPPLVRPLGHADSIRYFVLHSGIVVAVLFLGPGLGMRPRRGAVWRVYGWTFVFAAAVGLVDWIFDANYMFLRYAPPGSILEIFPPWPFYLLGGAAIGLVLFLLLDLPYRFRRPTTASGSK